MSLKQRLLEGKYFNWYFPLLSKYLECCLVHHKVGILWISAWETWIYTETLITFWLGRHKEVNLRQKRKWPHSDENNTVCQKTKWAGHPNLGKQGEAGRQAPALHKVLKPWGLCPPRWKVFSCDLHHHRAPGSDKGVPATSSLILRCR